MKIYPLFLLPTLLFLIQVNISAQDCSKTVQWIAQADNYTYKIDDCLLIRDTLEALLKKCNNNQLVDDLYHELGGIYNNCSLGYKKAIEHLKKAIQIRTAMYTIQKEDLARSYINLGLSYFHLRDYSNSNNAFEEAIVLLKVIDSNSKNSLLFYCYFTLGNNDKDIGELDKALGNYKQASKYVHQNNIHYRGILLDAEGRIYQAQQHYDKALSKFKEAKKLFETHGAYNFIENYPSTLVDIGRAEYKKQEYNTANTSFQNALAIYESSKLLNHYNIASLYADLILVATALNQFDVARSYFEKGLTAAKKEYKSTYYPIFAELHTNMATAEKKQNNYRVALAHCQQATKVLIPAFDGSTQNPILTKRIIGDKIHLRAALLLKAQIYQAQYQQEKEEADLKAALATYTTLDTLITLTRQSFHRTNSKYFLQQEIVPIYEQAINLALQLDSLDPNAHYKDTAFQFMARNKAIILIEDLQDEKVKFETIPGDLRLQDSLLRRTKYELEIAIYEAQQEGQDSLMKPLEDSLFAANNAYDILTQHFVDTFPSYYQHRHDYYATNSIKELQDKLEADRAIVEFFVGDSMIFVATITKNTFDINSLPILPYLEQQVLSFTSMVRGDSMNEQLFSTLAYQLYDNLLSDALKHLPSEVSRLTIIPDDVLLKLQWDALFTKSFSIKKETWETPDTIPYLIKKYALSQAYASALLFNEADQKRIEQASKTFGGFGIENYDFTNLDTVLTIDTVRILGGRLPHSDDEVREIYQLVGGDTLINEQATKEYFLKHAADYQILHLATHGIAFEDAPLNSALVFAKLAPNTDFLLRAADMFSTKINADMVVLSACQTQIGTVQRGEGMRTLSRAFAYAGSPALIASLGNVPDASTKSIFVKFYEHLVVDQPKDVALQQAKLDYLQNLDSAPEALPNRWAQIVLIGNPDPLYSSNFLSSLGLGIGGISGMLLFFFLFKKERKKKLNAVEERI